MICSASPNWTINQAKKILKSQTRAQVSVNAVKHTENRSTGLKVSKSTDQRSSYCSWGTGSLFGASCGGTTVYEASCFGPTHRCFYSRHTDHVYCCSQSTLTWSQHLHYDSVCFQSFGRTWETGQRFSLTEYFCALPPASLDILDLRNNHQKDEKRNRAVILIMFICPHRQRGGQTSPPESRGVGMSCG